MNKEVYDLLTTSKMASGNNWGCGVIVHDPVTGKILVGERTDTHDFCTPGGKVEVGETVLNALIRECLEESGLRLNSVKFMGYRVHTAPNGKNWVSYMFFSNDFSGTPKPQLSEIVSWEWLDLLAVGAMKVFPATDASIQLACKLGLLESVDNLYGVTTETINSDGNGGLDDNTYYDANQVSLFGSDILPETPQLYMHGRSEETCAYSSCGNPYPFNWD